jgi:PTH1 family peptidyl-tRNA hydrolase
MERTTTPDSPEAQIRIVVGLGNPGPRYEATRHNIGFAVIDRLVSDLAGRWLSGSVSETARIRVGTREVTLVKPQTYMNRSGDAVSALRRQETFDPGQVLVVCDDFTLPFSRIRLRRGGSDGGHNGLASVLGALGTEAVPRLRLGIGPVTGGDDINFVLTEFAPSEPVAALADRACGAVESCVRDGLDLAMNRFNGCPLL